MAGLALRTRQFRQTNEVPYSPNGYKAKTDDPGTWSAYQTCLEALRTGSYSGIGFALSSQDQFVCIDIDRCKRADGAIAVWAQVILRKFNDTYIEVSPSGEGFHIWCRRKIARSRSVKWIEDGIVQGIEVYQHPSSRYITCTGIIHGDRKPIAYCQPALDLLLRAVCQVKRTEVWENVKARTSRHRHRNVRDVRIHRRIVIIRRTNVAGAWNLLVLRCR